MHVQVYWVLMVTDIVVSSYVYVYTFVEWDLVSQPGALYSRLLIHHSSGDGDVNMVYWLTAALGHSRSLEGEGRLPVVRISSRRLTLQEVTSCKAQLQVSSNAVASILQL